MEDRILFTYEKGWEFFNALFNTSGKDIKYFAIHAQVSGRTVRSWRAGETSIPFSIILKWSKQFVITIPQHRIIDLNERRKHAGFVGGKARMRIYGELGTSEGRSKGGRRSLESHKKKASSPFVAQDITYPEKSKELAELIGAALGDGGMTMYQFVLYSNIVDEQEYVAFLHKLIFQLFTISPSIIHDPDHGVTRIISSRRNLVKYMESVGYSIGNKTINQVQVPLWIETEPKYADACLRGLVDTDGCVYVDRHSIKGKSYKSICIAFTNTSIPLLDFVEKQWLAHGYLPTRSKRDVRLRRRADVLDYAKHVGFSNSKHSKKIKV